MTEVFAFILDADGVTRTLFRLRPAEGLYYNTEKIMLRPGAVLELPDGRHFSAGDRHVIINTKQA